MRLLLAMMKHETNTFSPIPTDLRRFRDWGLHEGEAVVAAYAGTNHPLGAYLDLAREAGAEVVTPIAAEAMPSGPVQKQAYDAITGRVLDALEGGGFDGALLDLHGAMVAEQEPDGEGGLLEGMRRHCAGAADRGDLRPALQPERTHGRQFNRDHRLQDLSPYRHVRGRRRSWPHPAAGAGRRGRTGDGLGRRAAAGPDPAHGHRGRAHGADPGHGPRRRDRPRIGRHPVRRLPAGRHPRGPGHLGGGRRRRTGPPPRRRATACWTRPGRRARISSTAASLWRRPLPAPSGSRWARWSCSTTRTTSAPAAPRTA